MYYAIDVLLDVAIYKEIDHNRFVFSFPGKNEHVMSRRFCGQPTVLYFHSYLLLFHFFIDINATFIHALRFTTNLLSFSISQMLNLDTL